MKDELDHLDKVDITHRDERLRAPQPWKGRGHNVLLIGALVLSWIGLFFVLFLLMSHKRH